MSSNPSIVSFVKLPKGATALRESIEKCLTEIRWKDFIKGGRIFIKVNAVSAFTVPGQNTSPWLLDAFLDVVRTSYPASEIIVGDSDSAARRQVSKGATIWGYTDIARKHGASFINLSQQDTLEIEVNSKNLGLVRIPKILKEIDSFISLPVMKTHTWAFISCALKNQYGCFPRSRHVYHLFLDEVIVEINKIIRPTFALLDGTVGLEDGGPVIGKPKVCNVILASKDLVALDSVASRFMGFDPAQVSYLKLAESEGLGTTKAFQIKGDHFQPDQFLPPRQNLTSIWHKRLRFSPVGELLFETVLFHTLAWASTLYQLLWFMTKGKYLAHRVLRNPSYREFLPKARSIYLWR